MKTVEENIKFQGVENDLRVVHFPQLGLTRSFTVNVENEREAYLMTQALANQHLWLFENRIIPDYSNAIIVEMFDNEEKEWIDYQNDFEFMDWDDVVDEIFKD